MNRREALRRTASITGMAISSSISLGLLKGCTPSGNPTWPPMFLKKDEIRLVSSIAEIILPTTETPGALDVNVPEFVDLMLRDYITDKEKTDFRDGLKGFVEVVDQKYSDSFEDCSSEDKIDIIRLLEEDRNNSYSEAMKNSFYKKIKQLTILGYYTSEYVMQNMLDYHPIPGRQEGCIPLSEGGKLFVTNNI